MNGPPDERDAPVDDSTARGDGSTDPATEGEDRGERAHGRHLGKPAGAQRATRPPTHEPAHRGARPAASAAPAASAEPVLPRSPDDSDVGWNARPDLDDDERLLSDVPPHWQ